MSQTTPSGAEALVQSRAAPVRRGRVGFLAAGLSALVLGLSLVLTHDGGASWALGRDLWLSRATGWAALALVLLALSATPLFRLAVLAFPSRAREVSRLKPLRRAFGIFGSSLATLHAAAALFGYLGADFRAVLSWPYLRAGLLALLVLSAMLVTSFPAVNRVLRVRLWKSLHRLGYAVPVLVLIHLALAPFAPRAPVFGLFGVFFGVAVLGRLPLRRRARTRK